MSFDYQSQVTPEPKEMTGSLPTGLYCTFHIVFITVTAKKQLILELTLQAPIFTYKFFRLVSIYFLRELGEELMKDQDILVRTTSDKQLQVVSSQYISRTNYSVQGLRYIQ